MVIHRQEALATPRLLSTWALFAFSAGAVNAGALLACQRFVAHVTGTVTRIGVDAHDVLALDYLLVLVAFVAGAAAAILLARRGGARRVSYVLPLGIVASVLFGIAAVGRAGLFGVFGSTVESAHDFALLSMLGFAMGMQNAAVAASTAMAVRTTHMTGPATDIGVALALLGSPCPKERAGAKSSLALRVTLLGAFVVGATIMTALAPRLAFTAFLVPAVAIVVATVRGYVVLDRFTNNVEERHERA